MADDGSKDQLVIHPYMYKTMTPLHRAMNRRPAKKLVVFRGTNGTVTLQSTMNCSSKLSDRKPLVNDCSAWRPNNVIPDPVRKNTCSVSTA
jgi:hypothetical protein